MVPEGPPPPLLLCHHLSVDHLSRNSLVRSQSRGVCRSVHIEAKKAWPWFKRLPTHALRNGLCLSLCLFITDNNSRAQHSRVTVRTPRIR